MTLNQLGAELRKMYNDAQRGESVAMIHLFGIKYANEIKNCKCSNKDIVTVSGISKSYVTELIKGVKLSKFVDIKSNSDF